MYKRLIFRYYGVSIKTQRGDEVGYVHVNQPVDLNTKIVRIGKSVLTILSRGMGKSEEQSKGNMDNSASKKSLVEEHIVSVPQTDTGALVENTKASGRQWFKELGNKN